MCRILNNEIYAEVKVGKHLSSKFKVNKGLRQGYAIASVLLNILFETAIRRSKVATWGTIFDKFSHIMANSDDIIMRRILQDLEVFTSQYRIRNK